MEHRRREDLYRRLHAQQLFQGVSLDAVEYLVEGFAEQSLAAGDVVLQRGGENRRLYLLLEGEVAVHLDSLERPALYRLGPGECFGEMGLIDGGIASASVRALMDCRCLVVDEETLWGMVHRSHVIARNLLFILTRRMRNTNETISASIEEMARWETFALTDALTGLKNRRWLDESLRIIVGEAREAGQPLAVLMLDVDHFKIFNDRWGHPAGDQALRTVATVIQSCMGQGVHVARYGGEEFIILIPGAGLRQAEQQAEQLRSAIASATIDAENRKPLPGITVSIGISELRLDDPNDEPVSRADAALYNAKGAGRNRVHDSGRFAAVDVAAERRSAK